MFPLPAPLLADIGPFITGAILIISFIGWLSNIITSQQKPKAPQAARQQPRPRDKRVQDEIDAFLKEATGQERQKPQRPAGRDQVLSADEIEVVGKPQQRRPAPKPKPAGKPAASPVPKRPEPSRAAPGATMAQRHLAADTLGKDLQQHVRAHMLERPVGIALPSASTTASRLGVFSGDQSTGRKAAEETLRRASTPASELLTLLRGPSGVRQAIILGEVLRRPRFTRR
jgi:hypothetical protein